MVVVRTQRILACIGSQIIDQKFMNVVTVWGFIVKNYSQIWNLCKNIRNQNTLVNPYSIQYITLRITLSQIVNFVANNFNLEKA